MKRYKIKPWIILPILALITLVCLIGWQTQTLSQSVAPVSNLSLNNAQLTLEEIAPGIYGLIADTDFPNDDPNAAICNGGIIIGDDGVLVIDLFQTKGLGNLILNTVKTITDKPVRYAIIAHFHFDHTGGNGAALTQGIPILWRGKIRELMLEKNLEYDPNPIPPNLIINDTVSIWLGDRQVILTPASGHTLKTDLVVYVPDVNVMFTGDLLFNERFPYIVDGNIKEWQKTLISLEKTYSNAKLIPGHGPITDSLALGKLKHYLDRLESLAMDWKEQKFSEEEAINSASTIPEVYQNYKFKALYQSNLKTAYQQITMEN